MVAVDSELYDSAEKGVTLKKNNIVFQSQTSKCAPAEPPCESLHTGTVRDGPDLTINLGPSLDICTPALPTDEYTGSDTVMLQVYTERNYIRLAPPILVLGGWRPAD